MATLHLVPHTHWDREWYLPFQVFRLKLVHLLNLLIDTLERDPAFTAYTLDGQTSILEDYLVIRPERRSLLANWVRDAPHGLRPSGFLGHARPSGPRYAPMAASQPGKSFSLMHGSVFACGPSPHNFKPALSTVPEGR